MIVPETFTRSYALIDLVLRTIVPLLVSRLPVSDKVPIVTGSPGEMVPRLTNVPVPRLTLPLPETTAPNELVKPPLRLKVAPAVTFNVPLLSNRVVWIFSVPEAAAMMMPLLMRPPLL